MIKVGQIHEHKQGIRNIITCITKIRPNGYVYVVVNNGTAGSRFKSDFKNYRLLVEYPTWQDAVNSKEFKGE